MSPSLLVELVWRTPARLALFMLVLVAVQALTGWLTPA